MKIYFYPEANFSVQTARIYEVSDIVEFFDKNHLNPDEFYICGKDGQTHPYPYSADIAAVYPKIGKGGGKNIFTAVLGIFLTVVTGGAAAALSGVLGIGVSTIHLLGAGLLCYGAGSYMMGNLKMPQISAKAESATKESYQWKVGNLSTSRGVKGVTFGANVVPEGELLSYRTYGSSSLKSVTRSERYFDLNAGYYGQYKYRDVYDHSEGSANDTHYLEMLIGCGEGPLDNITGILVNGTPISDIPGATSDVRLGTNDQAAFAQTDLDRQAGYISVGQTIPQKLLHSDNPLVITTPDACDSVIVACQCSSAYNLDTSSGAKNSIYIRPVIKYRLSGSGGAWATAKTGIKEIDQGLPIKLESAFFFNIEIKFPATGTYEISLQNCSAEYFYQKNGWTLPEILPDHVVCALVCDNIACYNKIECTYPGTALIYLKLPASQALNGGMPKVTWKQSRTSCYVWDGDSYVTRPLGNPAWDCYDMLARVVRDGSTYHNEGESVQNFDYPKFQAWADFCSDLGITGRYFYRKLDSAWATAQSRAMVGRAFLTLECGKLTPIWDCAKEMTQIFTVGSYRDMSGTISAKKDRGRAVEVTFNDEDDSFREKTIRVEVDDFSADAEAASMTFLGVSTVEAAHMAGHYILRRNKYLTQTVKFTAPISGLMCELGDVIGVQCDITKFGVGGRIFDVLNGGAKITLSNPVTLSGGSYALLIAHEDNTLERKTPVETTGTYTQLSFSGAWTTMPKKGEQYTFGIVNQEVKKYKVTEIVRTSELECEITAVEYIPQLYVEGVAPDISHTNPNAAISNVTATENPEGIELAWNTNPNTAYVDVYVDGKYYGTYAEGSANIPSINSTQNIELIPHNFYGETGSTEQRTVANNIPVPSTLPMPIIQYVAAGYILTFRDLPSNQHLSHIVIYENGVDIARSNVQGDTCVFNLALVGGIHTVEAVAVNTYTRQSPARSIVLAPPQIAGWTIEYDQISSTNMQIKAEGSIQTADFVSGHNGWCLDKYGRAEFQDATIRGTMTSVNFVKDTVSAVGGSLMILGSAEVQEFVKTTQNTQNILCEDFIDLTTEDGSTLATEQTGTSVYYEITLDDASTFNNGDILRIRNAEAVQDLWLGQVSKSSNTLSCVMLYGAAMDLESGMCIVNYRKSGNGGILLNGNVPLMDMFTHSGRPWEGTDCWVRIGNIKGINSITDDRFGIFLGDSNGSHSGRHFLQYDEKSGKLQIQGEVLITSGATYNNISNAISAASTAQTTASTAQTTANTANTNANAALAFRNAVANTNYTSIKGGAVTTGIIQNSTYQEPSDQKFSVGSGYDLDHGHIHTPFFYVNDSGAGFKGSIETTAGKLNGINISSIITAIDSSCAAKTVTATYGGSSAAFKGVRGYCKLSNGIMAEWDIVPITWHSTSSSSGYAPDDVVVTLPVSIPNGSYLIILQTKCTSGNSVAFWYSTYNQTSTGFAVSIVGRSGAGPSVLEYMIIALAA